MDLRAHLLDAGVHPLEISHAEAEGQGALRALAFERLLIPGERQTPAEVFEQTGIDPEFARSLWRAMGFAAIPDDVPAFAEDDVQALQAVRTFLDMDMVDEAQVLRMTRLMGQAMARISDALISQFRRTLAEYENESRDGDVPGELELDDLLPLGNLALRPTLEAEVVYLLRRHLVDAARRQLRTADAGEERRQLAVGFADLVQFTEVSQRIDDQQLQDLIDRFEETASAIVTGVDGQVVKLIGDEVLFTTSDPVAAVDAALALTDAFSDEDVPDVRVGVACGQVLVHHGDVFGPVVNLASRAVGVANPGTVLVDEQVKAAVEDDPDLRIKAIRPRNLKGIGRTRLFVVREPEEGELPDLLENGVAGMLGQARRRALARLAEVTGVEPAPTAEPPSAG